MLWIIMYENIIKNWLHIINFHVCILCWTDKNVMRYHWYWISFIFKNDCHSLFLSQLFLVLIFEINQIMFFCHFPNHFFSLFIDFIHLIDKFVDGFCEDVELTDDCKKNELSIKSWWISSCQTVDLLCLCEQTSSNVFKLTFVTSHKFLILCSDCWWWESMTVYFEWMWILFSSLIFS